MMRTTLNLPNDVYELARSLSRDNNISLGEAVAKLARRGLRVPARANTTKAFPCFDVPADAKPITLEQTLEFEDEP